MTQYRMKVSAGGQTEDDEGGFWEGFCLAMKGHYTYCKNLIFMTDSVQTPLHGSLLACTSRWSCLKHSRTSFHR